MSKPYMVDTDVLIDYFRGNSKAVAFVNNHLSNIVLSSIVVAELYAGINNDTERTTVEKFISLFRVIPVGTDIACLAGLLKRDYGKSHGMGLADALLAATAIAEYADLITLNVKHFPMFSGLTPPYRK